MPSFVLHITCRAAGQRDTVWQEIFNDAKTFEAGLRWVLAMLPDAADRGIVNGPLGIEELSFTIKMPSLIPRAVLRAEFESAAKEIFTTAGIVAVEPGVEGRNPFGPSGRPAPSESGVLQQRDLRSTGSRRTGGGQTHG